MRYVGDAVAVAVAETTYQAEDALDLIDVDYEALPAVVDPQKSAQPDAPRVHADFPSNQAFHWTVAGGDVDAAFKAAEIVVKDRIVQQRLIPTAMETRSAVAQYVPATGELTLWNTTQNPHIVRFACSVVTGIPEDRLRVIAPEVGGGFGSKIAQYPGEFIAVFCSKKLGRPVKWTESRSENYQATTHGRDHVQEVELAATRDGRITGLRCKVWAGMGAYLSTAAPGIPTILHGLMLSGPYRIPAVHEDVYGIYTNTTPVEAYRGAGRPEATYMLERLIDKLARELKLDPVDVRRKNLIPPFDNGFAVVTGLTYDSGNYEGALAKALDHVGYKALRAEQARLREQGKYLGIGVSTYVEICGLGPSQVAGAVGFQGGLWESAIVRFHPTGKVNVFIGASPHGQGEETTFAQIVADEVGVAVDDVKVVHGDTDDTPMGWGTYGSRTTAVGGAALAVATRKIKDKAKALTAHLLEAAPEDIDYAGGKFFVKGSPDHVQDDPGHCAPGQRRLESARGHGGGARSDDLLRPAELLVSVRRPHRRRRGRCGDRTHHAEAIRGGGRLRTADQPGHRRRPGPRRRRPGDRPGAVGRVRLRRDRSAPDGIAHRLRDSARRPASRHRSALDGDAVAASPDRRERHRRGRYDRVHRDRLQRRHRRARAAGHHGAADASHA